MERVERCYPTADWGPTVTYFTCRQGMIGSMPARTIGLPRYDRGIMMPLHVSGRAIRIMCAIFFAKGDYGTARLTSHGATHLTIRIGLGPACRHELCSTAAGRHRAQTNPDAGPWRAQQRFVIAGAAGHDASSQG